MAARNLSECMQLFSPCPGRVVTGGKYFFAMQKTVLPVQSAMFFFTCVFCMHTFHFFASGFAHVLPDREAVCFFFALWKKRASLPGGKSGLSAPMGRNKYSPSLVRALGKAAHSQFLNRPPAGHGAAATASFGIPWSLCPAAAPLPLAGSWAILYRSSVSGAAACGFTCTVARQCWGPSADRC